MEISRREAVLLPLIGALPNVCSPIGTAFTKNAAEAPDWPGWAAARSETYSHLAGQATGKGRDIRSFGARLDGISDDTEAFERALLEAPVITIPGYEGAVARITRQLHIRKPVRILGVGGRPTLRVECHEKDLFLARPPTDDPLAFLGPVVIDSLTIERAAPFTPRGMVLRGYNLRGVSVTRCRARRIGIVGLHHLRQLSRQYFRSRGSISLDPAVTSGFSETPDDLCEDLLVFDCDVDGEVHSSQLVRFDFTRRVAIAHNRGRFASISWWGGGGRRDEGGDLAHLRRARDIYICDNAVSGSIGGIYGNNGQNVHVARNRVSMVTDIGIDFEGCVDALARDNLVENAGNFCFAALFAARNVRFENNVGIQDGSAKDIHLRYGARKVGSVTGRTLFALRGAGFGAVDGAIEVTLRGNRFAWTGTEGYGLCLPSYFNRLEVSGNSFENVVCGFAYRLTDVFQMRGNRLTFGAASQQAVDLMSASATQVDISGNRIAVTRELPEGSAVIAVAVSPTSRSMRVTGNRIESAGRGLPIAVRPFGAAGGEIEILDNVGARVSVPPGVRATVRGNAG